VRVAIRKARHFLDRDTHVFAHDRTLKSESGLRDRFECTECHGRLLLRSGQARRQHFSHFKLDSTCPGHPAGESAQHKLCKQLLADAINSCNQDGESRPLTLSISARAEGRDWKRNISLDSRFSAKLEFTIPGYHSRADVAVFCEDRLVLIIEIYCTSRTQEGTRPEPWIECSVDDILNASTLGPEVTPATTTSCLSLIDHRGIPHPSKRFGVGWSLRSMEKGIGSDEHHALLRHQNLWFTKWQRAAWYFVKTRKWRRFVKWAVRVSSLHRELVRVGREHHTRPIYRHRGCEAYLSAYKRSTNALLYELFCLRFSQVYLSAWKLAVKKLLPRWRHKRQRRNVAHCAWLFRELERVRTQRPLILGIDAYLSDIRRKRLPCAALVVFEQRFRELYLDNRTRLALAIQKLRKNMRKRMATKKMIKRCAQLFRELCILKKRTYTNTYSRHYFHLILTHTNPDCLAAFTERFIPMYAAKRAMTIYKSGRLRFRTMGYVHAIKRINAKWLQQERLWLVPVPELSERSVEWRHDMKKVFRWGDIVLYDGREEELCNHEVLSHLRRLVCCC
jgi:hypothetical protein